MAGGFFNEVRPLSWWKSISLRVRIFVIIGALVFITVSGGAVMIWYTYQMDDLFSDVIGADVAGLENAEELTVDLLKQKGFLSYYFITGDEAWLMQLEDSRREFRDSLARVKNQVCCGREREILDRVEEEYQAYVKSKDRVIALYKEGRREEGLALHEQVRAHFSEILALGDEFKNLHQDRIRQSLKESRARARRYRLISALAMSVALLMGGLLGFILLAQVLDPIRRLAQGPDADQARPRGRDEVSDLSNRVYGLIEDADHTRSELERSRERLFLSEKMAVVGKLAADMAHSIRNPMTSIKMRLFSLERSLEMSANQKEDFEVVAEEMRRLDNIVRNFLEFSRPPKLKKQRVDLTELLDMTLQLLQHRLERSDVKIERYRSALPEIEADPELLKEVMINLIVNACEAMKDGGALEVSEEQAVAEGIGKAVMIKIGDTGPGIPEPLQEKIFDPFFSTKEDGTGLGLSIVKRIIEEHGGSLMLRSREGKGTTFIITLPEMEDGK